MRKFYIVNAKFNVGARSILPVYFLTDSQDAVSYVDNNLGSKFIMLDKSRILATSTKEGQSYLLDKVEPVDEETPNKVALIVANPVINDIIEFDYYMDAKLEFRRLSKKLKYPMEFTYGK